MLGTIFDTFVFNPQFHVEYVIITLFVVVYMGWDRCKLIRQTEQITSKPRQDRDYLHERSNSLHLGGQLREYNFKSQNHGNILKAI